MNETWNIDWSVMVDWFSNGVKHAMMELVSSVVDIDWLHDVRHRFMLVVWWQVKYWYDDIGMMYLLLCDCMMFMLELITADMG